MKFLKAEDFIKRTVSEIKTKLLIQELQVSKYYAKRIRNAKVYTWDTDLLIFLNLFLKAYVNDQPCLFGHTLYDRIIRACLHQLGLESLELDHVTSLVELVELALRGYDKSTALVTKSSALYMEKIIFHIVKKLSSQETPRMCSQVAELLYYRLIKTEQVFICFN